VGNSPNSVAQALRRQLKGNPFLTSQVQWGVVAAVHGAFSSTLAAAAAVGTQQIQTNAAPPVNELLLIGTITTGIRVLQVLGSSAPYTVTLSTALPVAQANSAAVQGMATVDLYLNASQNNVLPSGQPNPAFLTPGVRYLSTYSPTVGDSVVVLRGIGGMASDRFVLGKLATVA
jgi:hypothetical protein